MKRPNDDIEQGRWSIDYRTNPQMLALWRAQDREAAQRENRELLKTFADARKGSDDSAE